MIPVKHIDPEDLPLYAMQLLTPDQDEEMSLHLQHSPEARRVLAEIYGDLALYAFSTPMQAPPAAARQRLLSQVAAEPKPVPVEVHQLQTPAVAAPEGVLTPRQPQISSPMYMDEPEPRSLASRVLPWLGWAAAAGLAVESGLLWQQRDHLRHDLAVEQAQLTVVQASSREATRVLSTVRGQSSQNVVLTSSGTPPPPQGRASYDADNGSLVFFASNLTPLDAFKTYELWLIPADGRDPIPAGTFHPDSQGNASVILPTLPKGVSAKAFGVTIEDEGGSTQPTKPILLKGQT